MGEIILLTGPPGIGKTTVLRKTIILLKTRGWTVGGMISSEIRRSGRRVGFGILDLMSNKSGTLAHIELKCGPHVGKYKVNLEDLEHIGVEAIQKALDEAEIVCCDEIAPMELSSPLFRKVIRRAIQSPKPFLATVHQADRDLLVQEMKSEPDVKVFKITRENRAQLHLEVVQLIENNLSRL